MRPPIDPPPPRRSIVSAALRRSTRFITIGAFALLTLVLVGLVVGTAEKTRTDPARCPAGWLALGPRCCLDGQKLETGSCAGRPKQCPVGFDFVVAPLTGCAIESGRVRLLGGTFELLPSDWEAEGVAERRQATIAPFALDRAEVTVERWRECVSRGLCQPKSGREPGLPQTDVSAAEAERFCQSAGGRLPTSDQWLYAAAGIPARRYPWGATGLVCRRAAFGLVEGPCGEGGSLPELAGARPDGASPEGVLDVVGNVAEWTREIDGTYSARGGSFRSRIAGELKSWSVESLLSGARADHVGFRCAYDAAKAPTR